MTKRWRRIGKIGGGVLALAVAGAAIFIATFDADSQKPRIAAAVKQATGRDLRLGGPIRLGWSLRPTLVLGDVAFSNPPGFSRPDMATVERVEVQLGLLPLLSHRIEIDRLTVVKPDIRLETDAQGQGNWVFVPQSAIAASPGTGGAPAGTKAEPLIVVVNAVRLTDGVFAWHDGKTGHTSTVAAKEIATLTGSLDAPLHVTASLALDGTELAIAIDTGPLAALTGGAGGAPFPVKVSVKAGGASIGAEGSIAKPATGEGIDLALTANIPDLTALSSLAHRDLPAVKALVFGAKLSGNAKELTLRDLKATSSLGDLGGDLTIALAPRTRLSGTLASKSFDADGVMAATAAKPAAPSVPGLPTPTAAGRGLIPDTNLPFEPLHALDADLRVSVGALRLGGTDYKGIAGHIVLKDGVLDLDPAQADLPEAHVALSLRADASKPEPVVHLKLEAPGIALQPLLVALGQPAYATGTLEVRTDLHGSGPSPHAIAASLDGYLGLAMPGGTVDLKRLGGAATVVTEALKPANGAAGANAVRCFALRLDFAKGVGTVRALALGSKLLNADGSGSVNLGDETLALNLRSRTVIGKTAVTMPVRVSGPMARPQTKVDEIGIAEANAAAIGSLLGGQAGAILGAAKQPAGGGDVCPLAMAVARGQAAPAAVAEDAPAAAAPAPGPQPKLPNAGQLLKQLFH